MPGRGPLLGAFLAAAGLYLLCRPGAAPPNRGDFLTFGCTLAFAVHILLLDVFSRRHPALPLTALQTALACPVVALAALAEPVRWAMSPRLALFLVLTAVVATTLCFTAQTWAQARMSPARAAVLFALEPVFAAGFSKFLGRERFGAAEAAGGALIVLGTLVSELWRRAGEGIQPRALGTGPSFGTYSEGLPEGSESL